MKEGRMIRTMEERELGGVIAMVSALAAHHGDVATLEAEDLRRDCFGAVPWLWGLVAEEAAALAGCGALLHKSSEGFTS